MSTKSTSPATCSQHIGQYGSATVFGLWRSVWSTPVKVQSSGNRPLLYFADFSYSLPGFRLISLEAIHHQMAYKNKT